MATPSSSRARPPPAQGPSRPGAAAPAPFTDEMRDRQAAGRDPYGGDGSDDDDGGFGGATRPGRGLQTEPFQEKERRGFAMSVLDNPDQLIMFAQSAGDSVAGQRLRFMSMLCGHEVPDPPPGPAAQPARRSRSDGLPRLRG